MQAFNHSNENIVHWALIKLPEFKFYGPYDSREDAENARPAGKKGWFVAPIGIDIIRAIKRGEVDPKEVDSGYDSPE
jgi:hypothetical protein